MKKYVVLAVLSLTVASTALARTDINIAPLDQADFRSFSRDFGMALSYIPLAPAAPLGDKLPGFDAGVEASYAKFDKGALWYQKMDKSINPEGNRTELPSGIVVPRVHVQVGLPIIPIDLGVSYAKVPTSDIKLVGYELKYAVLSGGVALPAIAIRGAYTKLSGVDAIDLSTKSVDLSISKGIVIFTPYAGAGMVWISSDPNNSATIPIAQRLQSEEIRKSRAFVGLKTKIFPFVNLVLEGNFSNMNVYSARLNVNF